MKIKVLAFNVYVKASKGAVSFCYVEASAAVRYLKNDGMLSTLLYKGIE